MKFKLTEAQLKRALLLVACCLPLMAALAGCSAETTTPAICATYDASAPATSTVFTTYTDMYQVFSISYPQSMEIDFMAIGSANETLRAIKAGSSTYTDTYILGASTADYLGPRFGIVVQPATTEINDESAGNVFVTNYCQGGGLQNYQIYSSNDINLDSGPAIIIEYGGHLWYGSKDLGNVRCLALFTVIGHNVWFVNCVSSEADFSLWSPDFNHILTSLKVND